MGWWVVGWWGALGNHMAVRTRCYILLQRGEGGAKYSFGNVRGGWSEVKHDLGLRCILSSSWKGKCPFSP